MSEQKTSQEVVDAAFDGTPVDLTRALAPTTATLANSTTREQLEKKARVARIIITVTSTLGVVSLGLTALAPWSQLVGVALLIASVIYATVSNTLKPEQLDKLVEQLADAGSKAAASLAKKGGGQ